MDSHSDGSPTVVDLSRVLAGSYCITMILADLGARVIKIENPCGGDDSRAYCDVLWSKNRKLPPCINRFGRAFVPYCAAHIDLSAGGQHQAEYVKLNPLAKVPMLVDALGPSGRGAGTTRFTWKQKMPQAVRKMKRPPEGGRS